MVLMVNFTMMGSEIKYPVFIGMFVAMLVFSPLNVNAQQDVPIPTVLPDSPFYNFKLLIENIQEAFTLQEDRKAELLLKHAGERDIEARALEAQGKLIPLERLKQIQADKIMKAEQIIIRLEQINAQIVETQQQREERQKILQAKSEAERIQIIQKIEDRKDLPSFIEPTTDRPSLIEPTIIGGKIVLRAETPVEIIPVEDIKDTDDISVILQKLRDRLTNSFTSSEITEIRADFQELQAETDLERKRLLADRLDEEVNNTVISITCFGRVDTFALSVAPDPVIELQEQCPILRPIPDDQLRRLANSVG